MHHVGRRSHVAVGQLRDVHQPVLFDADVDESPEGRDVGDDARQKHSLAQVADRVHVGVECEDLQLLAWVEPPFVERLEDVRHGRQPRFFAHVSFGLETAAQLFVG